MLDGGGGGGDLFYFIFVFCKSRLGIMYVSVNDVYMYVRNISSGI